MATIRQHPTEQHGLLLESGGILHSRQDAEAYVASICFKTGPPRRLGVELEWTTHDAVQPAQPLHRPALRDALGPYAPATLDPDGAHRALPAGSTVTVEPGGQVEISSPPLASLSALHDAVGADQRRLSGVLAESGLTLGEHGIDAHRTPRRIVSTPRYDAMADTFAREGGDGLIMMCSTAGLQVCLDAGLPDRLGARWAAVHALGPVLLATFANSARHAGRDTGWASARMRTWFGMRPERTGPVLAGPTDDDPALAWARYALRAPLVCVRRPDGRWDAPAGVTFEDWVTGEIDLSGVIGRGPTTDDLDYHLSTLFPPVRPRGYLEIRYLDAQPPGEWIAPAAVLTALLDADDTIDTVLDLCAPTADRWLTAARRGLRDPVLASVAGEVLDLACRSLEHTDLAPSVRAGVTDIVARRLSGGRE